MKFHGKVIAKLRDRHYDILDVVHPTTRRQASRLRKAKRTYRRTERHIMALFTKKGID